MSLLQIENLGVSFHLEDEGDVEAVRGASLNLERGETVALVGESGSGKSVTALSVLQLLPYPRASHPHGSIRFDSEELLHLPAEQMQELRGGRIAMVFQEPMTSLNPVLTVERQLTETLQLHMGMSKVESQRESVNLLTRVGIPDPESRIKQYPHQFSGGMRQRVMIAMALSCNPRLIIADEPTTALDVTIQAQILDLMKALTTEFGVALIVITHNLGVVARYADRVNIMYAGKVIERGNAHEIYSNPRHPYTVGLLRSVPRLDLPRKAKLDPIEGQPPDLINLPQGCSFRERCRWAIDKCAMDTPELVEIGEGHLSACFRPEELGPEAIDFLNAAETG